jgi:Zn-dependent peptidase ImmA (M78 family)
MHELSHIIIGHSPTRIDISDNGLLILHTFDRTQEEEAKWLCGCLLLPRPALLLIRRLGLDAKTAAKKYGTSEQMVAFRLNVLGLAKRQGQFVRRASSGRAH